MPSSASLLRILEESKSLQDIAQIDTLLDQAEERLRPETAANEDARDGSRESRAGGDASAEVSPSEETPVAGSAAHGEAAEGGPAVQDEAEDVPSELAAAPKMTELEEMREQASFSEQDRLAARADIYGTSLEKTATDKLMESMEDELSQIPPERKRSYHKARLADPLMFCSSAHAKLFLRAANFDPKRAAEKLVRYWAKREEFLGDAAFRAPGNRSNMTSAEYAECFRVYERAMIAAVDPDTEDEVIQVALSFIRRLESAVISDLDDELSRIPLHEKGALVEVQKSVPHLAVTDEDKLSFIRSSDFDVKCAARRMVNYWDFKLSLFGREVAFSSRVSTDPSDFRRELSLGVFSVVPGYDSSGRTLICFRPARLVPESYDHEGMLKSWWYVLNAAMKQYHAHLKGIVITVVQTGMKPRLYDVGLNSQIARMLLRTLPIKMQAVHECDPPSSFLFSKFLHPFVRYLLGKFRVRSWLHAGTNEQIVSELRECGMSLDQIPSELGGNFGQDAYERWLERQFSDGL